jgi:hypothetical protein
VYIFSKTLLQEGFKGSIINIIFNKVQMRGFMVGKRRGIRGGARIGESRHQKTVHEFKATYRTWATICFSTCRKCKIVYAEYETYVSVQKNTSF